MLLFDTFCILRDGEVKRWENEIKMESALLKTKVF